MPVVSGFSYDIFVSYRHNDNLDGWVTSFVQHLENELKSTVKEPLTIYFDKNPNDGLLETHQVGKSLEDKLKCLIFIPILSQTYCDPKSFAWQHEFCTFNKLAGQDSQGRDVRLANGNVASRILPVKIHDLDSDDQVILEKEIGSPLRAVDFIFRSAGVNRPLQAHEEHPNDNLGKTHYRDQLNKVANAIKAMVQASQFLAQPKAPEGLKPAVMQVRRKRAALVAAVLLAISVAGYFLISDWRQAPKDEAAQEVSVAVLPFVNLSSDPEQEIFTDGVTEQIITNLAHINSLKVIARTSVMKFKKTNKSIAEIGKELNVTHVLEGSIRKSDDRIRVTAQLIAVANEAHLWAHDYDRKPADIFIIQDEVSTAIVNSLQRQLSSQERFYMQSERSTSIEAYEHFLKGAYLHNEVFYVKRLQDDFLASESEFKKALALDPSYGLAWASLADLYDSYRNFRNHTGDERLRWEQKRDSCSLMALELSPNNPYVISVRSYSFQAKTDRQDADRDSVFKYQRRAFAIAPNDVFINDAISVAYSTEGLYEQAIWHRQRAISLDPTFGTYHSYLSRLYFQIGDYRKAEKEVALALLLEPDNLLGLRVLALIRTYQKDVTELERISQKVKSINPEYSTDLIDVAILALTGKKVEALKMSNNWQVYLALGMNQEALDQLEKSGQHYLYLKQSAVLNPLRSDPRFPKILESARLEYEDRLRRFAN